MTHFVFEQNFVLPVFTNDFVYLVDKVLMVLLKIINSKRIIRLTACLRRRLYGPMKLGMLVFFIHKAICVNYEATIID